MRALYLTAPGSIGNLQVGELPVPEPGPGEVRIKVEAAGLNPVDVSFIQSPSGHPDWQWPHVPAQDSAGTVDAVGAGVEGFAVGDRVANHGAIGAEGSLAKYRIATAETLAHVPDEVSALAAAALPCAGLTAYQAIVRRMNVKAGQTVLVTAAAGGVGGFAVQLARLAGARVIGTASSVNHEFVRSLGASDVISYRSENVGDRVLKLTDGRGVDAVLDVVSSESATENLKLLVHAGSLAFASGRPDLETVPPFSTAPSIHELALGAAYDHGDSVARKYLASELEVLAGLVAEGKLNPMINRVATLEEAPEALAEVGARHVQGKIVIDLS